MLQAADLRVDEGGAPACDGMAFVTRGTRVLLLGAPRALFLATTGLSPVLRGSLAVRGRPSRAAAQGATVAGAPFEPPLPGRWTILEYVTWSARLSAVPRLEAEASAHAAIDKLKLGPMARTPIAKLVPHARRATVVAAALATYAEIVALEDPLAGLPDEAASTYGPVLVEALADRAWLVFAARVPLGSPLALAADEAVIFTGDGRVAAQGAPAELSPRRFVGRFGTPAPDALAASLAARGARLESDGVRFVVDLGEELRTGELFALCAAANVSVVELLPALRALT